MEPEQIKSIAIFVLLVMAFLESAYIYVVLETRDRVMERLVKYEEEFGFKLKGD